MLCKGMVQFEGKTYRIVKLSVGKYEVIRILDDRRVGTFESTPRLRVEPDGVDTGFLYAVALTALKQAKVSWGAPGMMLPTVRGDSTASDTPVPR